MGGVVARVIREHSERADCAEAENAKLRKRLGELEAEVERLKARGAASSAPSLPEVAHG